MPARSEPGAVSRRYAELSRARRYLLDLICDDWPPVRQMIDAIDAMGLSLEQVVEIIDVALQAYEQSLGQTDDRGRLRVFCLALVDEVGRACASAVPSNRFSDAATLTNILIPRHMRWVLEA